MVIMDEGGSPRKLHWCEVPVKDNLDGSVELYYYSKNGSSST